MSRSAPVALLALLFSSVGCLSILERKPPDTDDGAACRHDDQCKSGACVAGFCGPSPCDDDGDCEGGRVCGTSACGRGCVVPFVGDTCYGAFDGDDPCSDFQTPCPGAAQCVITYTDSGAVVGRCERLPACDVDADCPAGFTCAVQVGVPGEHACLPFATRGDVCAGGCDDDSDVVGVGVVCERACGGRFHCAIPCGSARCCG